MKHLILSLAVLGQYPEEKSKPRVLIVEDEPIIGNLLEAGLTEAGFEASYFSTGAEALDSVHRLRPDIIISDTVMSPMDAYELRRRVRLSPLTARIPFIFLSSNHSSVSDFGSAPLTGSGPGGETETSDQSEGLRNGHGPDDCIYKPFKMENLIERVKAVMDRCAKSEHKQSHTELNADKNPMNITDIVNEEGAVGEEGSEVAERVLNPFTHIPPVERVLNPFAHIPPHPDFLNMLRRFEQGRLSGVLTVSERPLPAAIWFEEGSVVSAVHGNTVGKKALYRIFSDSISEQSAEPRFKVQPFTEEKTVEGSLNELIEEGSREIAKFRELKPATFESPVTINEEFLRKTSKLNGRPGLNHILSLARKYSLVGDIVAMSRMTDFQAYRHLFYLVKQGILTAGHKHRTEIQIITDSAADLPSDMQNSPRIKVIPLSMSGAGVSPRAYPSPGGVSNSGAGVADDRGVSVLNDRGVLPGVFNDGSPTPEDFHELFSEMIPRKDILAIFSSGKISGCFENAIEAKKKYDREYSRLRQQSTGAGTDPHFEIEIIDSRQLSAACCLLVAEAADRIEEGWEIGRIAQHIRKIIPMIRIFFVPETYNARFKAQHPQGRGSSLFSRMLGVRPVLSLWNGELTVIDQVRGRKNAGTRILEWIEQGLDNAAVPVKVGIMHADVPGWAVFMRERLKERFNCRDVIISRVSPSGGSYCGPGTVAVAYFPVPDAEQIVFKSYGRPV
ncbi:MAG: hypothetical protein BWK80_26135 [Desulfobacteraceae bacterium IS3]|nr:MAG: hypothetical protein BWK80_26135 [Desulfobacteraceae bacterium IS3]